MVPSEKNATYNTWLSYVRTEIDLTMFEPVWRSMEGKHPSERK